MGYIKNDVQTNCNLSDKDKMVANYFLSGFNVNYGAVLEESNTTITAFILEPEEFIKDGFGIDKEILLVISYYSTLEARTIQAAEKLFLKYPFKNRVDNLSYFLVSADTNIEDWLKTYYDPSLNSKIIFPFFLQELQKNRGDQWFIRKRLRRYSFDKDLFGYTLPLQDDNNFFGRQQILGRYIDSIKRCQNRGIFGLRKTGKTSLLFKINRTVEEQKLGKVFFYDCKNPKVRKCRWYELLNDINLSLAGCLGFTNYQNKKEPLESISSFRFLMKQALERSLKIILIFDEIEYISYFASQDPHWKNDYFEFWQTLWSEQSMFANLCFIVCGVNAYVTEKDTIGSVQNPLFGIIQSEYLTGLSLDETSTMIRTLGKRMGLKFDHNAIHFLYEQYGGHPMLTRMACSWLNRYLIDKDRPIMLSKDVVYDLQKDFDSDPAFFSYFGHIVSEIKQFYPDEYEMLEILSSGQVSDFIELSESNEFIHHLNSYGLITQKNNIPIISLPVAGRYIAVELAKREGRKSTYKLIEVSSRPTWLKNRVEIIINSMRGFENSIRLYNKPELFGINSFPEAEKLKFLNIVSDEQSFASFINTLYKCFVESIENYGKTENDNQYLSNVIAKSYPVLWRTLDKIKEYRNSANHLLLTEYHNKKLQIYLNEDLESVEFDKFFCLQQKLIIELITSIHSELTNLG